MQDLVIVAAKRTAIGSFQGVLSSLSAPHLGAAVIKACVKTLCMDPSDIDEVVMGEVLSAGVGQAPARQAALRASLPPSVVCTTVNKVCGSSLKAIMLASQSIRLGEAAIAIAGGMESMSCAPYLLPAARAGMRMGNAVALDSMIHDGLWDPYSNSHMGTFGDLCATTFAFSRQAQDDFAHTSYTRALAAQKALYFQEEIVPLQIDTKKGALCVDSDEEPSRYIPEKIAHLKAAFGPAGSVTAANASKINDGAAAVVLMSAQEAKRRGLKVLARIVSSATYAQEPAWFTTAPSGAIERALKRADLGVKDIGLFEINEAFACVAMAAMKTLDIPHEKLNVWGGAIALGHPIGASGARILTTLISAMHQKDVKYGCASLCIGGGEAVAMILQRGDT